MEIKRTGRLFKVLVITLILMSLSFFAKQVHAEEPEDTVESISVNSILDAGHNWISNGSSNANGKGSIGFFVSEFIGIGQILVIVGIATLVIVSVVMAFRWIVATPDKQAKLKQQLIGLIVATVVIFGAVGIWNFVTRVMNKIENNPAMLGNSEIITVATIVEK